MNESKRSFWWPGAGLILSLIIAVGAWYLPNTPDIPPPVPAATNHVVQVQNKAVVEPMTKTEAVVNPAPINAPAEDPELALRLKMFAWTKKDLQAALAWASGLSNPAERQNALTAVCCTLAEKNPSMAVTEAETLHLGQQDANLLPNLVQQWAAKDLQGALYWSKNYPVEAQREDMLARVAFVQAQTDPAAAARLVVEKISPGAMQDNAAMSVLSEWASRDHVAATAWAESFPDGPLKTTAEDILDKVSSDQTTSDSQSKGMGSP